MAEDSAGQGRKSKVLMDEEQIARTLARMTHEIAEQVPDLDNLALVGIQRRGVELAARLATLFGSFYSVDARPPAPSTSRSTATTSTRALRPVAYEQPVVHSTDLPFDVNGKTIVLVDDVLYTGRTIRAAIDALFDYGRPRCRAAGGAGGPGPSRPAHPPRLRGQERAHQPRRSRWLVHLVETDGVDEVVIEEE